MHMKYARRSVVLLVCTSAVWLLLLLSYKKTRKVDKQIARPFSEDLPTRYRPRFSSKLGIAFHIEPAVLRGLGVWPSTYVTLSQDAMQRFVFGMAVSYNHFNESIDSVASLQRNFPDKPLYLYDIGLKSRQVIQIKTMCNVQYRKFDFDRFPGHVRHLRSYAFKPLIIMMLLEEFDGVFYVDSSVRLHHNRMAEVYKVVMRSGGLAALTVSTSTVFQVTYPERYMYLPTNIGKLKELIMFQPGTLLIYKTESIYRNIVYWWVVCMLEQFCGAPHLGKHVCKWKKDRKQFVNCDRYDQSTLNILTYNYYNFNEKSFIYHPTKKSDHLLSVKRDTHPVKDNITYCG